MVVKSKFSLCKGALVLPSIFTVSHWQCCDIGGVLFLRNTKPKGYIIKRLLRLNSPQTILNNLVIRQILIAKAS